MVQRYTDVWVKWHCGLKRRKMEKNIEDRENRESLAVMEKKNRKRRAPVRKEVNQVFQRHMTADEHTKSLTINSFLLMLVNADFSLVFLRFLNLLGSNTHGDNYFYFYFYQWKLKIEKMKRNRFSLNFYGNCRFARVFWLVRLRLFDLRDEQSEWKRYHDEMWDVLMWLPYHAAQCVCIKSTPIPGKQ